MAGLDHPLGYKKYFPQHMGRDHLNGEIEMIDSMVAEIFGIQGIPIDYYPSIVNEFEDPVFGDAANKKYIRKHQLTAILKDGVVEETLLFNGFGQLNSVEFGMYLHINTYKNLFGIDQDPKPSDQFTFPFNTNLRFEVMHVGFTTLGMEGNVFGHRTCYEIICKEAELSYADEGFLEQYGIVQPYIVKADDVGNEIQVVLNNRVTDKVIEECDVGVRVFLLANDVPCDAILPDGRVADKYLVPNGNLDAHKGDNQAIRDIVDKGDPADFNEDGVDEVVIKRDRNHWGNW